MRTIRSLNHFLLHNYNSASCGAEHNTALNKAQQADNNKFYNMGKAVHYKPCTNRELQIDKTVERIQDATAQVKKRWSKEISISTQYLFSKKPFMNMLSQF